MRERRDRLTTRRGLAVMALCLVLASGCTRTSDVYLSDTMPDAKEPAAEATGS